MAPYTVGIILLMYRGQIRQFTTAADALQCVRRDGHHHLVPEDHGR